MIANLLDAMGLDYEYERELTAADGSRRYPDFTIEDTNAGRTLFLEHLGMLNDRAYRERWQRKVEWYRAQGIVDVRDAEAGTERMLVTTLDDERGGLDSADVERAVRGALRLS